MRVSAIENIIDDVPSSSQVSSIDTRVSSLETSFPAGCNTIMQAVTAKGVTPASNSPTDIATAISNINTGVDLFPKNVTFNVKYVSNDNYYKNYPVSYQTTTSYTIDTLPFDYIYVINIFQSSPYQLSKMIYIYRIIEYNLNEKTVNFIPLIYDKRVPDQYSPKDMYYVNLAENKFTIEIEFQGQSGYDYVRSMIKSNVDDCIIAGTENNIGIYNIDKIYGYDITPSYNNNITYYTMKYFSGNYVWLSGTNNSSYPGIHNSFYNSSLSSAYTNMVTVYSGVGNGNNWLNTYDAHMSFRSGAMWAFSLLI